MNKKIMTMTLSLIVAASVIGCDKVTSPKAPSPSKISEVDIVKPVETIVESKWCANGEIVGLSTVTSKGWLNGVSREKSAILLDKDTVADIDSIGIVWLAQEDSARDVVTVRALANGRQILKLSGGQIMNKEAGATACMITR